MPKDEQYEWPSFKTVLRDVAASDGALTSNGSESPAPAAVEATDVLISEPEPATEDIPELLDLLPEPLAPVDFDTSAVRALLEPIGEAAPEPFELDALEPLAPVPDEGSIEVLAEYPESTEVDTQPFEPDSVFDLAFDPDAYPTAAESDTHDEPEPSLVDAVDVVDVVAGIEIPAEPETTTEVFTDLAIANEISLDDVPAFAADIDEPEHVSPFDDPEIPDVPSGAVFELDASTIEAAETDDSGPSFDSVATANAIEGELNELTELESQDPSELFGLDNVIPLHPESGVEESPIAPAPVSGDWMNPTEGVTHDQPPQARVSHTGWVGLETGETRSPTQEADPDPWAHMRPTEEPKSEGFWAKVFGGDERRRAKARRLAKKNETASATPGDTHDEVEAAFDTACPNCGSQCQVDLDDPIGRRVHVSCPDCDHMWNTPYYDAEAG